MDARTARGALVVLGGFRVGVGAALLARPALLARTLGVDSVTAARVEWLTRTFAVRELVLGLGEVRAGARRAEIRDWAHAAATSDAVDAVVLALAAASGRVGRLPGIGFAAAAAGSAAVEIGAWRALAGRADARQSGTPSTRCANPR